MTHQERRLPVGGAYAIAILALIAALAGGAYAAIKIEKNSVKSKHIKDGQVKNQDVANDAINGDKVAADSLTGADIAELGGADIAQLGGADIGELGAANIGELSGAELPIKWAFVNDDGTLGAQSGGISMGEHTTGSGLYRLNMGVDLSNYAIIATPYFQDTQISSGICGPGAPPQSGCPGGTNNTNHADILTEDNTGTNGDAAFFVAAIP